MTGSGAGAGGGGAAAAAAGPAGGADAGQGQQAADGQQQAGTGFDAGQLSAALEALHGGQEDLRALLQSAQQGEPGQDGHEPIDGDDGGFDDGELDGYGYEDGEPFGGAPYGDGLDGEPGELAESLASSVDGYMQSAMEPLERQIQDQQRQIEDQQRAAEYRQLAAEMPEMGDPAVVAEVTEAARTIGDVVGLDARTAMHPAILKMIYMSLRASEAAAEEEGREYADPEAAHLEGGGGAAPAGGQQGDAFDRMLKQRRGSAALPFGGGPS